MWPVENQSGEEIPPYACMKVVAYYGGLETIGFSVDKPDEYGAQWGHIFNGPRPIPATESNNNGVREVAIGDLSLGLYEPYSGDPDGLVYAGLHVGPRAGSWKLHEDTGGFFVCGPIGDQSDRVCIVRRAPMLHVICKTGGSGINTDQSGTVSVYWSNPGDGGTLSDTGVDITVYNRFESIGANKFLAAQWHPWGWEMVEQDQT
jgi:hypothetical protein